MSLVEPVSSVADAAKATSALPLFVDLDGTLLASDSLVECLLLRAKHRPLDLLRVPGWLAGGKARLKERLADDERLDVSRLPYREDVLHYLRAERAAGRRIYLATGADRRVADRVALHLDLFDGVIASEGEVNLTGPRKLAAIQALAPEGFVYAANSREDLIIWKNAAGAVLVNAPPSVAREAQRERVAERVFTPGPVRASEWLYALRVHQWMKNLLVFVALLTSFRLTDLSAVGEAVVAFIAFSLCASAVYVLNDLLDLEADRAHPRKRYRPFASGRLSIPQGVSLAAITLGAGLAVAFMESFGLTVVILCYLLVTTAYTWYLKARALVDVITLAALYALRIVGGSVAIGVPTSVWLLAFALFLFLSLALAKRCSELLSMKTLGLARAQGRSYRVEDLTILWPTGIAAGVCSVLVFALFISADELPDHYSAPSLMWFTAMALFYWLAYVWLKTGRGEMLDDPVVFAVKDGASRIAIAVAVAITIAAHFIHLPDATVLMIR